MDKMSEEESEQANPLKQALLDRFGGEEEILGFWDPKTGATDFELRYFQASRDKIAEVILEVYIALSYKVHSKSEDISYNFQRDDCLLAESGTYNDRKQRLMITSTVASRRRGR